MFLNNLKEREGNGTSNGKINIIHTQNESSVSIWSVTKIAGLH